VAGLRNFTTPSLEDVERRRWQLWSVAFFVLVGLALSMLILSFQSSLLPQGYARFTSTPWLRLAMMGVIIAFCLYTIEKEIHLRRITRVLVDERVLTAALSNRLKELSKLSEVGKALNSVLDIDDVLGIILSSCLELLAGTEGSIMLLDDDQALVTVCCQGEESILGTTQALGTGISGWVALHREPLLLSGEVDPALFDQLVPKDRPIATAMCVPLISRGELLGVLNINDTVGNRQFSEYDLRAMCLFAEHAAIAISNARLFQIEREHVARLLEVDRLKSEFVATVSHELRTPLTSILGSASTLRKKVTTMPPEQRDQFLSMIDRQGKRLLRLIEDILFASRIEAGEHVLHPEPCDLAELAQEVVDNLRSRPGAERLRLLINDSSRTTVFADPMAVQQILFNLTENALKYAPGEDPIDVEIHPGRREALVVVADHGPGIDGGELPTIFERFRQVDQSITRRSSGVGLGLYIVRNLVEGLDGRIWCDSEPGLGCRFSFTLPAHVYQEVLP
jgi:signal transduction histidine kinase